MIPRQGALFVLAFAIFAAACLTTAPAEARKYAAIVIDAQSGAVLHSRHADARRYPASLTKMMTLYMIFEALEKGQLSLDDRLKISRRAAGQPASKVGLRAGRTIKVRDAILSLVTKSANDVATVVAESLAGTEVKFARQMTKKARQLGMTKTTFRNASGLPHRKQVTTARDMARLSRALLRHFPQYYDYFSTRFFQYGGSRFKNHNALLRSYSGADGIKTGYIRASGFNLAASAERNGRRVIAVVFGGRSARTRNKEMERLLNLGFSRNPRVFVASPVTLPRRNPLRTAQAPASPPAKPLVSPSVQTEPAAGRPANIATGVQLPRRNPFSAQDGEAQAVALNAMEPAAPGPAQVAVAGWQIQVGAYSGFAQAHAAAVQAAERLTDDTRFRGIFVDSDGHREIYRARLVGFQEMYQAAQACAELRRRAFDCFVTRDDEG